MSSREVGSSSGHVLQTASHSSETGMAYANAIPAAGDGGRRDHGRPRRQRRLHSVLFAFFWCWVPEIAACVLSVGAILSIAIVLRVYDGHGLDDLNLPSGLTLNGLIAALSTFDRVFLMVPIGSAISQEAWLWFSQNDAKAHPRSRLRDLSLSDNASRGVWGALLLIVRTPWRWLTVLGCMISILSLGIGIFTQQLIAIEMLPVQDNSLSLMPGNIQHTRVFQNYSGNLAEGALTPLLNMKAAIYNGFMATPGSIDNVVAKCPSGNCTFPVTPSLAICGDCMETSVRLGGCNVTTCNYTSEAGTTFQMGNWSLYNEGIGFVSKSSRGYYFAREAGDRFYLANFETFGAEYSCLSSCIYGQARPMFTGYECALWWCVNMYNTTISNGQQTQAVVKSFKTPNETKQDVVSSPDPSLRFPNITYDGTNYTVLWLAYTAITQNIYKIIDGTVFLDLESYATSSDITLAIWSGVQTPKTWVQTVATSMSNVVRTGTPDEEPSFNGTGYQLGVQVRWKWLALPIVSVAASIILLLVVMVRTARSEVFTWKGSPLTFLLFDVDPQIRQAVNSAGWTGLASGVEKSVGQMKATLRRKHVHDGTGRPGGWVLEGARGARDENDAGAGGRSRGDGYVDVARDENDAGAGGRCRGDGYVDVERDENDAGARDENDAGARDENDAGARDENDAGARDENDAGARDENDAGARDENDAGAGGRSRGDGYVDVARDENDAGAGGRSRGDGYVDVARGENDADAGGRSRGDGYVDVG